MRILKFSASVSISNELLLYSLSVKNIARMILYPPLFESLDNRQQGLLFFTYTRCLPIRIICCLNIVMVLTSDVITTRIYIRKKRINKIIMNILS